MKYLLSQTTNLKWNPFVKEIRKQKIFELYKNEECFKRYQIHSKILNNYNFNVTK